ncbi:DUF1622 domain-containing protein [Streptomyces desertarenae]|uniref:DUF1622 domain-containing protein n=1 Tax=Streptomyces desertarenae TaxID=2666184 RepID=A0ABW4PN16_9ACTN
MNVFLAVDVLPESALRDVVDLLVRLVEAAGALIIFVGAVWAFGCFLLAGVRGGGVGRHFNRIRLSLGRFLLLGLEFQLAGDVLRTAVAPSFTEIGQLAAIAAIRTALNFFLGREIAAERAEIERERRKEEAGEEGGGTRTPASS